MFPLQIKNKNIRLFTSLEKLYIRSAIHHFLIKTLYKMILFNLAQLSLIVDKPEQLMLGKRTPY
jgi:hypothetical protein